MHADGVDRDADQPADHGAVDPDELQVPADVQLDPAGGLPAVPALDRVGDHGGDLGAVPVDHEDRGVGGQPVEPRLERRVGAEPRPRTRRPRACMRWRTAPCGSCSEVGQGPAQRVPERDRRADHGRVVEDPLLERLGAGLGARGRQQVAGSWASTESSAARARCWGSSRMSSTQLTSSAWIRPVTASLSRGGAHHGPARRGPRPRCPGSPRATRAAPRGPGRRGRGGGRRGAPRTAARRAAARSAPPGTAGSARRAPATRCGRRAPWQARWPPPRPPRRPRAARWLARRATPRAARRSPPRRSGRG